MSDQEEQKLKRKVQITVIAAMSLFFVLVTVVVFQFAIRINQEAQIRSLTKQNEALASQTERAKNQTTYFSSEDFIRDYALRYLNRGKPGDTIFS